MADCKCDEEELCEECPEWIFTLADLIMCMMGLFVILWVLKPGDAAAAAEPDADTVEVLAAIREAFGHVPDPTSNDPVDMHILLKRIERAKLQGDGNRGNTLIEPDGALGTDPEVQTIRDGKQSVVGGRLLFERGSSQLTPDMLDALEAITKQIKGHRNVVMITGHLSLDDMPESAGPRQQMALSLERAQRVADYFIAQGVSPDILRVQGASTFEPVVQPAYSDEAKAANRRVEVEVKNQLVKERADLAPSEPRVEPGEE